MPPNVLVHSHKTIALSMAAESRSKSRKFERQLTGNLKVSVHLNLYKPTHQACASGIGYSIGNSGR
jgi:hypothetical protein